MDNSALIENFNQNISFFTLNFLLIIIFLFFIFFLICFVPDIIPKMFFMILVLPIYLYFIEKKRRFFLEIKFIGKLKNLGYRTILIEKVFGICLFLDLISLIIPILYFICLIFVFFEVFG